MCRIFAARVRARLVNILRGGERARLMAPYTAHRSFSSSRLRAHTCIYVYTHVWSDTQQARRDVYAAQLCIYIYVPVRHPTSGSRCKFLQPSRVYSVLESGAVAAVAEVAVAPSWLFISDFAYNFARRHSAKSRAVMAAGLVATRCNFAAKACKRIYACAFLGLTSEDESFVYERAC